MRAIDSRVPPHGVGQIQAPSVETGGASVPHSASSPPPATSAPALQPDGHEACLGAAHATPPAAIVSGAAAKRSSKTRKGPRRPRREITMTEELSDRTENIARRCSVSVPELIRNLIEAFGEKLARRAEAHANAESRLPHPPAAE